MDSADAERTISIQVNGKSVELERGDSGSPTVASWLDGLGRDPRTVAIERNGEILPRARYAETPLEPGDRLEVVQFVQGG